MLFCWSVRSVTKCQYLTTEKWDWTVNYVTHYTFKHYKILESNNIFWHSAVFTWFSSVYHLTNSWRAVSVLVMLRLSSTAAQVEKGGKLKRDLLTHCSYFLVFIDNNDNKKQAGKLFNNNWELFYPVAMLFPSISWDRLHPPRPCKR